MARTLIIIGGHEDKEGDAEILCEVAARVAGGRLVVAAVASKVPGEMFATYEAVFRRLGVKHISAFEVHDREAALQEPGPKCLADAVGVFFTGGDQLRITSVLGGTPILSRIEELYRSGAVVAGTSAGASVVCQTMLVSGDGERTPRADEAIQMAPGLGLLPGVVVDQHFAERGRIGRLVGAVAQNPASLGIGVDENTAVVVESESRLRVVGAGAVYVIDARESTGYTVAAGDPPVTTVHNLRLHVLGHGEGFDLATRVPKS